MTIWWILQLTLIVMPTILLILLIWVDRVVLVTGMTQPGEMRQFFGLFFLMGIVHKPCLDLFWSKDPLSSTPTFNAIMSCNRFQLILKFLHFNDIAIMAPATSKDLSLTTCLRGSRNCTHQPEMLLLMNLCFFGREGRLSSNTYSWKDPHLASKRLCWAKTVDTPITSRFILVKRMSRLHSNNCQSLKE